MAHGPRGGSAASIILDDISKRIIEQLQADGRQSYAAIGKAVDAQVPRFFAHVPRTPLIIQPYPEYRARYEAGTAGSALTYSLRSA